MAAIHRIREIRHLQQISLRTLARKWGLTPNVAGQVERPDSDLSVSRLQAAAECLGVPIGDLVCDTAGSELPRLRGFVVRVLKNCAALLERLDGDREAVAECKLLTLSLRAQALELVPSGRDISPEYLGARRPGNELGKIAMQPISEATLFHDPTSEHAWQSV